MKRTLVLALVAALHVAPATAVLAQAAPAPKTYDMRDAPPDTMQVWIKDPNMHAFYQATVDAFARGPEHVDRAAYEKRSHEIFTALAQAHNMPVDALLDHLKGIPGEMILIATREPQTLTSYDKFAVALFGPQNWSADTSAQR